MYYQENGVNEIAAVCNVTFKGMEMAGSFTKNTAKAFLKLAKFVMTSGSWAKNKAQDSEYRKAGKKRKKVMKDKFQGEVLYGKLETVTGIMERQGKEKCNLSEDQMNRIPDKKWLKGHFEKLAKAHGLEYCILPNKLSDNIFIQYPKQQEAIYQEVMAELQGQMKKECETLFKVFDKENEQKYEAEIKACKDEISAKKEEIRKAKEELQSSRKINDRVGENKYGEKIAELQEEQEKLKEKLSALKEKWNQEKKKTGEELMEQLPSEIKETVKGQVEKKVTPAQYLEESGLINASDKEFDEIMRETFPKEYAEVEKSIQEKAEIMLQPEKKKEFVRQVNRNTRNEAKEIGLAVDVEVPAAAYVKSEENAISFPHPDYPEFMVTVPADGICGLVDDSKANLTNGKAEGYLKFSVYKDTEIDIKVPVMDAVSGKVLTDKEGKLQFVKKKMSYGKFDKYVNEMGATAAVAMLKRQKELQRAARKSQLPGTVQKGRINVKK